MVAPFKQGGRHPKTQARVRMFYAATSFSPLDLFTNGEQGAWYDPSDLSTLYQDSAGTIPVTADGDPVGLMLDKSGNGNHASQSTSAARPVYDTESLIPDAVDDVMTVFYNQAGGHGFEDVADNVFGFFALTPSDVSASGVATWTPGRSIVCLRDYIDSFYRVPFSFGYDNGNLMLGVAIGNTNYRIEATAAANVPQVVGFQIENGTDLTLRINGATVATGTAPYQDRRVESGAATLSYFARTTNSKTFTDFYAGSYHGGVLRAGILTDEERDKLEANLASLAGVTL